MKLAIDVGYRHFDGALVYLNEREVGRAIREKIEDGTVTRDEIFYCGKVFSPLTYTDHPKLHRKKEFLTKHLCHVF